MLVELCPSENQLLAFTLGRSDPAAAKEIVLHLGTCVSCETVMMACMQQSMASLSFQSVVSLESLPEAKAVQNSHERYRIEKTLGLGGMGIVYLAQDLQLGRTVALKLVHAQLSAQGSTAQARLLREAQTMAKLNHPHLVPVYDVGFFGERLFFTMEYIEGQTLREYLSSLPDNAMRVEKIRALFAAIGGAIAAAHNAGVIHGDLKPENILIKYDGTVKVADFGLAHLEHQGSARADGGLPQITGGTPAYMAPEQKLGQLTAQSDQYSFCLMLYEALTKARSDALKIQPFPVPGVPKQIRSILAKGLARIPAHRYKTMEELLAAWPVPPVSARRYWLLGCALLVILNVLGILGWQRQVRQRQQWQCQAGTRQVALAWNQEIKQKLAQRFLQSALPFAPDLLPRVEQALDGYFQKWATQSAQICTAMGNTAPDAPIYVARQQCLQERWYEATELLKLLINADDALLERSVVMVLELPELTCQSALFDRVAANLSPEQKALAHPWRLTLVDAHLLRNAGKWPEAEQKVQRIAQQAAAANLFELQAQALYAQGDIQSAIGKLPAAEQSLLQAVDIAESYQEDRVAAQAWTGMVLNACRQVKLEDGIQYARRAQAAIHRLGNPEELQSELDHNLGCILQRQNHHSEAVAKLENVISRHRAKHGELSLSMSNIYSNIALSYWRIDRKKEALAAAHKALAIAETALGIRHPQLAFALNVIGNFMAEEGDPRGSIPYFLRALHLLEKTPNLGLQSTIHYNLGLSYQESGQKQPALTAFHQALKIRLDLFGPQSAEVREVQTAIQNLEK